LRTEYDENMCCSHSADNFVCAFPLQLGISHCVGNTATYKEEKAIGIAKYIEFGFGHVHARVTWL